jgi:hypothetical protein
MRWAGHVTRMGEERKVHKILMEKSERKKPLGRPRRRWRIESESILRWLAGGSVWSVFSRLRIGTGGGLLWTRWWTFGFWRHVVSVKQRQGNLHICYSINDRSRQYFMNVCCMRRNAATRYWETEMLILLIDATRQTRHSSVSTSKFHIRTFCSYVDILLEIVILELERGTRAMVMILPKRLCPLTSSLLRSQRLATYHLNVGALSVGPIPDNTQRRSARSFKAERWYHLL